MKKRIWVDIMSKNAIISLSMLYALWQSKQQDLLDLLTPFTLFAVGMTTKVGDAIDSNSVCSYMENEFGYKDIQIAVIERILMRETSKRKGKPRIRREKTVYYLQLSLDDVVDSFIRRRTDCKAHSDAVSTALAEYLNTKWPHKKGEITKTSVEQMLLCFFEKQGSSIVRSVEDLRQIFSKGNEIDFFIAKFILEENDKQSVLMDYIVELVKGYFVATALYLQAENPNVTKASFNDVTFYLDTRILLAYLGYKSNPENDSVQAMVRSLKKNGAKLACFAYNIEELRGILDAYKQSTVSRSKHPSSYTLEYFDEHGSSYTHVDMAQRTFEKKLHDEGIVPVSPQDVLVEDGIAGIIDENSIQEYLRAIKPTYNFSSLPDDLTAINAVSRIRKGQRIPYIERSKAVFVTTNTILVSAVKNYLKNSQLDYGFPIVISGSDLCVLAWLKSFEQSNSLPKMRLLESVMAATTPSNDLMDAYYSNLDVFERSGELSNDEVALLRMDLVARKELMELTYGDKNNLNSDSIREIKRRVSKADVEAGRAYASAKHEEEMNMRRNAACKRAELEVEKAFEPKEKRSKSIVNCATIIAAIVFLLASIHQFCSQMNIVASISFVVVTVVTTIEGVLPFFHKKNWITRVIEKYYSSKKAAEIDRRKREYMSILK